MCHTTNDFDILNVSHLNVLFELTTINVSKGEITLHPLTFPLGPLRSGPRRYNYIAYEKLNLQCKVKQGSQADCASFDKACSSSVNPPILKPNNFPYLPRQVVYFPCHSDKIAKQLTRLPLIFRIHL